MAKNRSVVAVEVKAKTRIGTKDLKGLKALKEEALLRRYLLVSNEDRSRKVDGIHILTWKDFMDALWADELLRN